MTATYTMTRGDAQATANTLTEMIGHLIPGYTDLENDDATLARYTCAALTVAQIQQLAAAQATDAGTFDPEHADEPTLTAIFASRTAAAPPHTALTPRPLDLPELGLPLQWTCPVPLFLTSTDYAPYTDLPRPTGNVFWVDPANEHTFLTTLAAIGVIAFYVRDNDDTEAGA